jgi:enediyne biosynthesis protein E4
VVTNLGRNSPYRVSPERPARLYYGDLSGEGHPVLLEAKYDEQGRLVPAQNKPDVEKVLPFVAGEYPTFHAFASATLEEIVGAETLGKAQTWEANTVESVLLRNDGAGRFTIEPLPLFAQVSTGYGVVMSDFNGDGHTDAYLAQNCFAMRRELGYIDGGVSILLEGNEKGQFKEVMPRESGLVVPGDAKSAVAADINGDNWPDLVVGVNNAPLVAFQNERVDGRRMASVRLRGRAGNPTAVGARVSLRRSDGLVQTAEVAAGGGYLSQQPPSLYFGLGDSASIERLDIRWPDGQSTTHRPAGETAIQITQPEGSESSNN